MYIQEYIKHVFLSKVKRENPHYKNKYNNRKTSCDSKRTKYHLSCMTAQTSALARVCSIISNLLSVVCTSRTSKRYVLFSSYDRTLSTLSKNIFLP